MSDQARSLFQHQTISGVCARSGDFSTEGKDTDHAMPLGEFCGKKAHDLWLEQGATKIDPGYPQAVAVNAAQFIMCFRGWH
jgi:hypothetical protein